ncbi:MAG: hypothetical protein GC185_05035 [Alphaproteobacteria bacterium]|nr:hypothetical protein [Alphaproteobacteria bacterium]
MTAWVAISGSWRKTDESVEKDVREAVRDIIAAGDGIVTGGALGVDYIATDEALKCDPAARQIKIILPTSLKDYANHYFRRADEGVITQKQARELVDQLTAVQARNTQAVVEMDYKACNQQSYYARNSKVIEAADRLLAFQVNESAGTQDAIDKARARPMPVTCRKYSL